MSVDVLKKQIFNFLASETPEVMAIKGEWGVGKTYSWKKFLVEANSKNKVKLNRYSYVSLFGINSLEAFKYTIFENVIKKEIIGTEASIETFKNNATGLIESFGRQSINFFKGVPVVKNIAPAIETISFLSLSSTLICIDDLERKGKSLDIKDILGLVSLLKEQKKCKIVLLLNDGEEGLEEYTKYREKVIDIELKFAPSPRECAAIAYSDDKDFYSDLSEHVTNLGIKNIRILKKIETLVDLAVPLAEKYEPEILAQVIHSLALYSWCYYCSNSNKEVPTLDFVTDQSYSIYGLVDDEKETEEERKWKTILQSYNYQLADELDLVVAAAVKDGFFVEDEFESKAITKNEEIIASKSKSSFTDAWKLYHDSFDDNRDEVINVIFDNFQHNYRHISPSGLNGTVSLFRKLGENKKASKLIDLYIEKRKDQTELFDLEEINTFGEIQDSEIIDKFSKQYSAITKDEDPLEILERISDKSGWSQKDEVVLANTSIDRYFQIFKTTRGKKLSRVISACLRFGQFVNASDKQKEISNRAIEALKRIGNENDLNRIRVKKFGIDI